MWTFDQDGNLAGLQEVGVFVLWTAEMADLPMRCKVFKHLQWGSPNACEGCYNVAETGAFTDPTSHVGCAPTAHWPDPVRVQQPTLRQFVQVQQAC